MNPSNRPLDLHLNRFGKCDARVAPPLRLRQAGISMVEIMVALAVGLLLMLGVTQIFVSSKQTYRLQDTQSRIQENLRFALEAMDRDIRMAGYFGCGFGDGRLNTLTNGAATWWTNLLEQPLIGYDGTEAFAGKAVGTTSADRITGTDVIVSLKGDESQYGIAAHDPAASTFSLTPSAAGLETGDIVVACNAAKVAMFQITTDREKNDAGSTINNDVGGGGVSPDNAVGITFGAAAYTFTSGAVTKFEPRAYYIGKSTSGLTSSLFVLAPSNSGGTVTMTAQELVENVIDMQILFGVTQADGKLRYMKAADVTAGALWGLVTQVRVSLLLVSPEDNVVDKAMSYVWMDDNDDEPASVTPADRRLYRPVSTTIALRNRLP